MKVLKSAFRHGIASKDIQHALRHAVVVEEVAEDPIRYLVLGPDRAGQFVELVVLDRPNGPVVIQRDADETEVSAATTQGR
jgi:hypothetical protein